MPNTYIRRPEDRKPQRRPSSKRVYVPNWVDPFPWAQGSSIEKMVMAELLKRGIYFQHSTVSNPVTWVAGAETALKGDPSKVKADILVPQYRIWIEIQGAYFHTLPGAVEKDSLRFALIEASGWRPIYWWEDDIRTRLVDIMNEVPEFYRVNKAANVGLKTTNGYNFFEGEAPDTLAGLRSALSNRARPPQRIKVRRKTRRRPK